MDMLRKAWVGRRLCWCFDSGRGEESYLSGQPALSSDSAPQRVNSGRGSSDQDAGREAEAVDSGLSFLVTRGWPCFRNIGSADEDVLADAGRAQGAIERDMCPASIPGSRQ